VPFHVVDRTDQNIYVPAFTGIGIEQVKALIVPGRKGVDSLELIAETPEESEQLKKHWFVDSFDYVSCEEWRQASYEEKQIRGRRKP
jgi:hypothetical protein